MLTRFALQNPMFVLALTLIALIAGPLSFLTHPSREDPKITIREASVQARFAGMAADKVEQLITQKLEEKIREMPEVDEIRSTSSTGQSLITIAIDDDQTDLDPIWTTLRDKMTEVANDLPAGTSGPFVDTDRGDVAMATIALTADGFGNAEMHAAAKEFRRRLYANVDGVRKITFFGVLQQQVFVEFDTVRLAQLGLDPATIIQAVQNQNVIQPGGQVQADGQSLTIQPTGDFGDLSDIRDLPIALPEQDGGTLYLSDIADISLGYQDPPGPHAYYKGKPAIIVAVSMIDGYDAGAFGATLEGYMAEAQIALPLGLFLDYVTFQPDEIDDAVYGVLNNLWQTVLIVLIVVIAFLGFRTGMLVGAMVPLVMVGTILVMRVVGIDLERMSLASLIIALGLLVDNGIVIAEDLQARLARGEDRKSAALATGKTMSGPLLAASLTTIFAFMPLMLMPGGAGEYTRSISLVLAIALIASWAAAMTILILFCSWFLKRGEPVDEDSAYNARYFDAYRAMLRVAVRGRWLTVPLAFATIVIGAYLFSGVTKTFFPASERAQLQITVELPVGANSYATRDVVERLQHWLGDTEINPDVSDWAAYVATGGPRFYLSLSPIDGFPNKGYLIVNLDDFQGVPALAARVRAFAAATLPEARVTPEQMSLGPGKAGEVAYRVFGRNTGELIAAADAIKIAMRQFPGARDVKDDWENPSVSIRVLIDQTAARRDGVTSADIADALNAQLDGIEVSSYRVGDLSIPVIARAKGDARVNIDRLRTMSVGRTEGGPVPLLQVAELHGMPQYARIKRQDLERLVTVSAVHATESAAGFAAMLAPDLARIRAALPPGYRIEVGGELEGSEEANEKLSANMPLAAMCMLLVLIWQFNSFVRPALIVSVIPLTITGVAAALIIAPGANFGFMAILGFLALMGIVINNAIILIDRIDQERERQESILTSVVEAGVRRLRPIIMTTCTTALGLIPIIAAKDVLFYDLALVIAGGLLFGTLLTLVVTPALYAMVFGDIAGAFSAIKRRVVRA